jgi:hypothetical protein
MGRRIAGWDEQDAYTRWRRLLRWRPGQIARIKRHTHQRERRAARREITDQLE